MENEQQHATEPASDRKSGTNNNLRVQDYISSDVDTDGDYEAYYPAKTEQRQTLQRKPAKDHHNHSEMCFLFQENKKLAFRPNV